MEYMKKIVYTGMVVLVAMGMLVKTASAISIDDLLVRINELTAQVDGLMKQLGTPAGTAGADVFLRNLNFGMRSNKDVRKLQQFLIDKGYLGGTKATGNFFALTRSAIKQFQAAVGVPVTGMFDRQTRGAINEMAKGIGRMATTATSTPANEKTILVKTATSTAVTPEASITPIIATSPTPAVGSYHIDPRPTYDIAAIERATFDAVNGERIRNGLGAVRWNNQLADVARAHSSDQANDNVKITNPDVGCLYPYIRHEGFVSGFKVGDRLDNKNIPYAIAGENIIIFPMTKELIYRAIQAESVCKEFGDMEGLAGETQEEAYARIQKSLSDRLSLMAGQQKLNWVSKQWKDAGELASESTADWMNSPGHRHNILTPEFEEGAIGAAVVNDYIIMTEVFLKK